MYNMAERVMQLISKANMHSAALNAHEKHSSVLPGLSLCAPAIPAQLTWLHTDAARD